MCGGFIGDVVGGIGDLAGDIIGGVGDIAGDILEPVVGVVEDVGDFILDDPLRAAAIGLAGYGIYNALAAGSAGAAAGAGAASEAAFLGADAAQLAAQGLSEAQIAQTLGYAGVDSAVASQAANLAAQGVGADVIAQKVATDVLAPVDYGLLGDGTVPGETGLIPGSTEGLRLPTTPEIAGMGGGQGLTVPVAGGTVTGAGFIPVGSTPALGDPGSFINDPNVLGQPVFPAETSSIGITDALRGMNLANQLMGGQQQPMGMPGQQAPFQPAGVDYSGILGLLGRQASIPNISSLLGPAQIRYPSLLG